MEVEKPILSPFDYEEALFNPQYQKNHLRFTKMRSEFEFLPWLFERREVVCEREYSEEYVRFLTQLGAQIHISSKRDPYERWFRLLADIPLERKLNSRLYSHDLELKLFPEMSEIKSDTYLIKSDHSFSGTGIKRLSHSEGYQLKKGEVIEAYHQRLLDFGVTPHHDKLYFYLSFIDRHFQYKGSLALPEDQEVLDESFVKDILTHAELIWAHLKNDGAKNLFSIDSYLFYDGKKIKYRPLVEINYRLTMGKILQMMIDKWGVRSHYNGLFILANQKWRMSFDFERSEGLLCLSPIGNRFTLCFVSSKNKQNFLSHCGSLSKSLSVEIHKVLSGSLGIGSKA
jgi:hypothetical protein